MKRATLLMLLVLCVLCPHAESKTWFIRPDGTGDVPDIKTGIELASRGDTLLLADGIFTGPMNADISYKGKAIVITSQSGDPGRCVIDCEGSQSNMRRGFEFSSHEGSGSVLEGITIRNGYSNEGAGLWCWSSSPTIRRVILSENEAVHFGGGIYAGRGAVPTLTNVTLYGNSADQGGGVYCTYYASAVLRNSIIAFGQRGGAVVLTGNSNSLSLECCDIYGNAGGDWEWPIDSQLGVAGNIKKDPLFCMEENPTKPFGLNSNSPCIPAPGSECDTIGACGVGCRSLIHADVEIHPDVIGPRRRVRRLTCYIELFEDWNPLVIDISTVFLNGVVPALAHPTSVGDHDEDGIPDRMVNFSWCRVLSTLNGYGRVGIEVSGKAAGVDFVGMDTILVRVKETTNARDPGKGRLEASGGSTEEDDDPLISASLTDRSGLTLKFSVPEASRVGLAIYDVRGRLVRRLLDEARSAGSHSIAWDGKDDSGAAIAPGVYFATLKVGSHRSGTKAVILR